jgi:hypothetical protein
MAAPLAALLCAPARAGTYDLGHGTSLEYQLTLNYALGLRLKNQSDALINGPVDPGTGLPTTVNGDDGDRNFKTGSLINNRLSSFGQLLLSTPHYGIEVSGDAFYDQVYHHPNDNDSPATINKSGSNTRFSDDARYINGARARWLDAYAYGNWTLGQGVMLDLRAGRQVVAWGESLFFAGVAASQGPDDATKAFVPGAEIKDILLPSNQVSARLAFDRFTLLGYYKLQYKASELFPVGDYFSTSDGVGPGAEFLYEAQNPLYASFGAVIPGTPPDLVMRRGPDLKPSDFGQWGLGLKYDLTRITSVGLYYLRYSDANPSLQFNIGPVPLTGPLAPLPPPVAAGIRAAFAAQGITIPASADQTGITTSTLGLQVPASYNQLYYDGIHLYGSSLSTVIGHVQVSGELNYRDGTPLLLKGVSAFSRGKVSQALLSGIYTLKPSRYWDDVSFAGEVGYTHVHGVAPVQGVEQLADTRNTWGYEAVVTVDYYRVLPGVDLAVPMSFAAIAKGMPAQGGAFGSLAGEGDQRASIGCTFSYLQRLQAGFAYNAFLGRPSLAQHPYADRDYLSFNLKYDF